MQGLDNAAMREYQLELGICGAVRDDGVELLQVQPHSCGDASTPLHLELHLNGTALMSSDGLNHHTWPWQAC